MAYDDRVIDQVQSLNDIVEIISSYVPLKRSGRSFKACCPFHQEKTPSFMVHPEKQIFHCFGCGAGGDVFSFLMKYEQLTFPEALARLAERVHVTLPVSKQVSPKERSETEELYQIYQAATEFYHAYLKHPESGKQARSYLEGRGFGREEIETFKLGFSPAEWRKLFEFLSKKGFREQSLLRSGLIVRSSQGSSYDLFRGRVMFPICNAQGKPIALGGRVMGNETPKYLNSPESPIFRKRKELYNIHLAKMAIGSSDEVRRLMIVEGYLDVVRLYVNGFKNVVATLGTSLTPEHVHILKRYADEAIAVFDGDKAGEAASLRGLDIFLEESMSVKVLSLPKGFDPDSLIKTKGREAMAELIGQSQDVFDFKLGVLLNRYNRSDSLGLLRITSEFLETFSKIKNSVLLDRYLKKLAVNLGVQESSLRTELQKIKSRRPYGEVSEAKPAGAQAMKKEPSFELNLMSLFIQYPDYFSKFKEAFPTYEFSSERTRGIFQTLETSLQQETRPPSAAQLMNRLPNEGLKTFASELCLTSWEQESSREQVFRDCVGRIRELEKAERLAQLRNEIAQAEELGDQARVLKAVKAYQTLLNSSEQQKV